jgi:hypothetical protein
VAGDHEYHLLEGGELTRVGDEPPTPSPAAPALTPPHPNPFNPSVSSTALLPSSAVGRHVLVTVYDAKGRRVATLFDTTATQESIDLEWTGLDDDGRTVASGVYHLRLEVGDQTATAPLTYLR